MGRKFVLSIIIILSIISVCCALVEDEEEDIFGDIMTFIIGDIIGSCFGDVECSKTLFPIILYILLALLIVGLIIQIIVCCGVNYEHDGYDFDYSPGHKSLLFAAGLGFGIATSNN